MTVRLWILAVALGALAASYLSGCCAARHIDTTTRDSVRVETHFRTEYVYDTVILHIPAESIRQTVRDTVSHLETDYAVSDARITPDGSLFHSLANKPQERPVPTDKEVIYRDSIVYRDRVHVESVAVPRPLTAWQRFRLAGFWVLSAAVAAYVAGYIVRRRV